MLEAWVHTMWREYSHLEITAWLTVPSFLLFSSPINRGALPSSRLDPSPSADTKNSSRGLQPQARNPGAPEDRVGHTRSLIVTLRVICCVALEKSLKEDLDQEWKYICILFCIWLTTGFLLKCWKQVNVWKSNLQQYKTLQFCPHASIVFFLASLPHLAERISLKNKASE